MWPLTTVTSGPLIPVAVPEAATQACNFQAGQRPGVTPLLNQSLNQTYLIISWLPAEQCCLQEVAHRSLPSAGQAWGTGRLFTDLLTNSALLSRALLPGTTSPSPPASLHLSHQSQAFLAPSHGLNHALLLPKGPQLGFLPDNLTICTDNCRALSHKKWKSGPEIRELAFLFHPCSALPHHLAKCLN